MHLFHSGQCKSLQNVDKYIDFHETIWIETAFAKHLQPDCKRFATNSRRTLQNRCNKFAKSLQIWMVLQKLCNNIAKLCFCFTRDIAKNCNQFANSLQNLCKLLQSYKTWRDRKFALFCKQFVVPFGKRDQDFAKNLQKIGWTYFHENLGPA